MGFVVITIERYQFNSVIINKIAASTLSVYLLSESGFGQIFFNQLYLGGQEFQLLRYLLASIGVFVVIIVCDKIRLLLRELLCNKLIKKRI